MPVEQKPTKVHIAREVADELGYLLEAIRDNQIFKDALNAAAQSEEYEDFDFDLLEEASAAFFGGEDQIIIFEDDDSNKELD